MGFSKPSKIQERALPLLLANPYVSEFSYQYFPHGPVMDLKPTEHDRAITIGHREDGSVRSDNA